MAEKEFESDDPMELVGTAITCTDADIEEMGMTYVEEYIRMLWPVEEILAVFANPHYRGPHTVYRAKGAAYVRILVQCATGGAGEREPAVHDIHVDREGE